MCVRECLSTCEHPRLLLLLSVSTQSQHRFLPPSLKRGVLSVTTRSVGLEPCVSEGARGSAHRGTTPSYRGCSGRLRPYLRPCAAIPRGSVRGPTSGSRGRRMASRVGRRLHRPSTAGSHIFSSFGRHLLRARAIAGSGGRATVLKGAPRWLAL